MQAGLNTCISGIARNLYYNGYDYDQELLGAAVQKVAKKIVSKVKRIKKGGVSVTTGKGSLQYSQPLSIVPSPDIKGPGISEKLKDPKVIAGIAGGIALLYIIMKKKK